MAREIITINHSPNGYVATTKKYPFHISAFTKMELKYKLVTHGIFTDARTYPRTYTAKDIGATVI